MHASAARRSGREGNLMADPVFEGAASTLAGASRDGVSLGRITQRTTPGSVALVIRNAILEGRLKPGSQLRETHLAADLGVSRAPLREALGLLAEEGLVDTIPYRGAFVAEVTQESIAEIARLRKRLEPYAIELALPHLRGSTRILEDMALGADDNNTTATIDAHMAFHRAFYELYGHQLLLSIIDTGDLDAITAEIDRHVHGGLPRAEAELRTAKDA